jgi:DNA polymerase-1
VVGAISKEPEIINAYKKGEDIHAKTASIIFNKPIEEITDEERARGKTINFSILYGSTAYGIAQKNADISEQEAEELLSKFFAGYPKLARFVSKTSKKIYDERKSVTPMGRIRFFEDKILFGEGELNKFIAAMKREGFNHIIQGGSADSLKIAMVYAFNNSSYKHDDFRFLNAVHDEVVVEIREDLLDEAIPFLIDSMEKAEQIFLGDIPAKADYIVADYWAKE